MESTVTAGPLRALVIGSTGAIGRELVSELLASNKWSEVHVVVRRELEQWATLPFEQKSKLRILKVEELDVLQESGNFSQFAGLHAAFCCLGTRTKYGKEIFLKVDYHYPLYLADIALTNNIPHYSLVSSKSSDSNSCFFYLKTKGQLENALRLKHLKALSIYQPGLLLNRDNDARFGEKVASYIPFISKIDVKLVAIAMRKEAEQIAEQRSSGEIPISNENVYVIDHDAIARNAQTRKH